MSPVFYRLHYEIETFSTRDINSVMIYFIQVKNNGPVKISGLNPWHQSGLPVNHKQFDLIEMIPGSISLVRKIQADLKPYRLADPSYRLIHEWYQPAPKVLDYVKKILCVEYEIVAGVPRVVLWRDTADSLTDHCPVCGEQHWHRSGDGLCVPHCRFCYPARYAADGTPLTPIDGYIIRTRDKDSSS